MTGYDAATVEACASVAELLADAHEAKSLKLRATGDLEDLDQSLAYARSASIRRRVAVSIRALPIAPPAPLVTADDVAVKRHYPDDGGLKAPVREVGEPSPCFGVVLRHFRPDLHPPIVAAPLQVTADEVRQCTCHPDDRNGDVCPRKFAVSECALARRAAPAVEKTELDRLREALEMLIAAVEFEVPPIIDGIEVKRRAIILMQCAVEARAALNRKWIAG